MDHLDSELYYSLKESFRSVVDKFRNGSYSTHDMPVVLVDFYNFEAKCFDDEYDTKMHVKEHHSDWNGEPPSGEDEELVVIKFCTDEHKERWPRLYNDYRFFREINGQRYYRQKSFVGFEPELIINVSI